MTTSASFDELLERTEVHLKPILVGLRQLILAQDPQACEVVRLGDRAASYGIGPKRMSEAYVYILAYSNSVNLGFYQGVKFLEHSQLLEGNGKRLRHIKIRAIAQLQEEELKRLLSMAIAERKAALKL